MSFQNKTVWITGASSGIGEALAKAFNENGAKVVLSARNQKELERVQSEFRRPEVPSLILPLDMTATDTFDAAVTTVLNTFGETDILIHNAGISQRALATETDFEDEQKIIAVNLTGPIGLTKKILPHYLERKKGHIVIITSVMAKIGTKYRSSYAASKHGLTGYFDCLRLELEGIVEITNIMPGFVNTNIVRNAVSRNYNPENQNLKGLSPEIFARRALRAIAQKKREVYIGGIKEGFALWMKRFFPGLFHLLIIRANVT
ncbi:MAG: SDR family NAD(P)-dependent oxidoreductase [Bacteroidia bacterium]|nr:SDR family NAD(P)-dependent oxidoreductase [Bacteroidia bacterium]